MAQRSLGYVEHVFESAGEFGAFVAVRVVRISGPLSADDLRRSLRDVQQEIALLRTNLTKRGKLRVSPFADLPLQVFRRCSPNTWKDMAAIALRQQFPKPSLLWRAWYLESVDSRHHELLFAFHHAISDGSSVTWLVNRLLRKCQARLMGLRVKHSKQTLPQAVDDRLPRSGVRRATSFVLHRAERLFPRDGPVIKQLVESPSVSAENRSVAIRFLKMSRDETTRMLNVAKREMSTVEGTMMAAMLLASSKLVGDTTRPFACSSSVNLRPACGINPDIFGCFAYWVETLQRVRPNADFWQLARQASEGIRYSKESKGLPPPRLFGIVNPLVIRNIVNNNKMGRTNAVGVSNLGKIDLLDDVDPIQVKEMYSLAGQHAIGSAAHLIGGSVYGRMLATLMFTSPICESAADTFIENFQSVLSRASKTSKRSAPSAV